MSDEQDNLATRRFAAIGAVFFLGCSFAIASIMASAWWPMLSYFGAMTLFSISITKDADRRMKEPEKK